MVTREEASENAGAVEAAQRQKVEQREGKRQRNKFLDKGRKAGKYAPKSPRDKGRQRARDGPAQGARQLVVVGGEAGLVCDQTKPRPAQSQTPKAHPKRTRGDHMPQLVQEHSKQENA